MHSRTSAGHDIAGGKVSASTNPLSKILYVKRDLVGFCALSWNFFKSTDGIKVSPNSGKVQTNQDFWSILGNLGLILNLPIEIKHKGDELSQLNYQEKLPI